MLPGTDQTLQQEHPVGSSIGDYSAMLKDVRDQLGLSQEDLAHELGVSFSTVNRWENGHFRPSRLARARLDDFCAQKTREGKLRLDMG
jgi:DNA-binding transcriptional regulator YiaG